MNIQWREFIPNYEVSDQGEVRRSTPGRKTHIGRVMKAQKLSIGYLAIRPTVDGKNKTIYIHDAVASAFLGPKPAGLSVNHIDGDKTNNSPSNLEYVTHAENMRHAGKAGLMVRGSAHPAARLDECNVRALRGDRDAGMSFSNLAAKYQISIGAAFNAATKITWSHVA